MLLFGFEEYFGAVTKEAPRKFYYITIITIVTHFFLYYIICIYISFLYYVLGSYLYY